MAVAVEPGSAATVARDTTASGDRRALAALGRTAEFWRRASGIYLAYKAAQVRMSLQPGAKPEHRAEFWQKHHTWAGKEMYKLCIDLRGFYLKASLHSMRQEHAAQQLRRRCLGGQLHDAFSGLLKAQVGQFLGARGDFVPVPVCKQLSGLHDQVTPVCAKACMHKLAYTRFASRPQAEACPTLDEHQVFHTCAFAHQLSIKSGMQMRACTGLHQALH